MKTGYILARYHDYEGYEAPEVFFSEKPTVEKLQSWSDGNLTLEQCKMLVDLGEANASIGTWELIECPLL